jgi:hypothetical protein
MNRNNDDGDSSDSNDENHHNVRVNAMANINAELDRLNNDIYVLWRNVILPYISNLTNRNVLTKLSELDYDKFYKFMIEQNEVCKDILNA